MKLILFGTSACHLCEIAEELLKQIRNDFPQLVLEQIDIAEQTQWQTRYAVRIPVLFAVKTQRELSWPFDKMALFTFITELEND